MFMQGFKGYTYIVIDLNFRNFPEIGELTESQYFKGPYVEVQLLNVIFFYSIVEISVAIYKYVTGRRPCTEFLHCL